jgi:adenosine/AMP kinase
VMEITAVTVEKPEDVNVIFGQSHFIKTVEDLYEAMVQSSPGVRFGVAFCEASGPRLVRRTGNDDGLTDLAVQAALAVGAGHSFFVFMRDGFPINCLNAIKMVPEVCGIWCATANPLDVVVGANENGRAVLGVVDGGAPLGVETDEDEVERKAMLRTFGYKQ